MKIIHPADYYQNCTASTSTVELVEDENGKRFYREKIANDVATNSEKYIYIPKEDDSRA
jgi:hypothetical protein